MTQRIIMDCHNHSNLSPDGDNPPEKMVQRAIELGIEHYALTDHCEINLFYEDEYPYEEPVRKASEICPLLKEKYADKIDMSYGVELGQPLQNMELTNRVLSTYNYDFIIGSLHMCNGYKDFYELDYNEVSAPDLLKLYYEELLEMAKWAKFDVMGHITYPLRYIKGDYNMDIDMKPYESTIKEIFRQLIKQDKGIEINSSGLRQKIGTPFPDAYYINMYKQMGGKILTIGSDAHRTVDLGKGVTECISLAKEIGFNELTFFKKRNPVFIKI